MKLNPFAIMSEQFDGTGLVFNPESNAAMTLNKTGVYLWKRLSAGDGEAALVRGIMEKYQGVTETQAEADVKAFLAELKTKSLLSEE